MAAGLLIFAAVLRADGLVPGRSVAPPGDGQSLSQTSAPALAADLDDQDRRLRDEDSRLREQDGRIQDEALRLSRTARSLDELSAALSAGTAAQERLSTVLEGLRQRVESLELKLRFVDEEQGKAAVTAAAGETRLGGLDKDLAALKLELRAQGDSLAAGLKELEETRGALAKLDTQEELLAMLKKDTQTNDEELVEVKQGLKRLEPQSPAEDGAGNAAWWEGVAGWKYLPAVATGLGVVALGVAAFHH